MHKCLYYKAFTALKDEADYTSLDISWSISEDDPLRSWFGCVWNYPCKEITKNLGF